MHVIGGVEFGTGSGALRFAPIVVCSGEESFETGTSFLLCSDTFTGFAVIEEESGLINELEGDADYLLEVVGSVSVGSVFTSVFDPVEKGFNLLVNIVRGAKNSVVFLKIRRGDAGVGGVKMIQDGAVSGEAVSSVLVSEGADEHFANSREKNFSRIPVGAIVIVEECGGSVKSIAKFSDLGASGFRQDDSFRARVDRHDEGDRQQSVVDGGCNSHSKKSEGAATKAVLDRGSV